MKAPLTTLIHEAGHVVIALRLGVVIPSVSFYRDGSALADYGSNRVDSEARTTISLAGILSNIELTPDEINAPLLRALRFSIIFDEKDHPPGALEKEEPHFPLGADTDLHIARTIARKLLGTEDTHLVTSYLRNLEQRVKGMIVNDRSVIADLADMMDQFLTESDDDPVEFALCFVIPKTLKEKLL